jgi:colanic acid/amylovoran biosynthesis glycosyltransferase
LSERAPQIAYVTTGYPYVSHTFILGEVLALRRLGTRIETFALRREPLSECRTAADREAWETTYALRPPRWGHWLNAHARALLTRPGRYLGTARRALELAGPGLHSLIRHAAYFVQAVVLWDRCRRARIRHVHAHFANVSSDVALLAAELGGPDFHWSFTMHGPTEFYDVTGHRLAEKASAAAFVVCISEFARSQLMTLLAPEEWSKLHVVHCGVDTERFAPPAGDADDGPLRIACVGRLVPEKGQALLVDAVMRMRAAGVEAELVLVGDGPERPALEQRVRASGASGSVRFLGAVGHHQVEATLRDADVFCLASFAEGVPIVLMEAMAMERAVVASAVMGIPELIEDGVSGRLVRPGSLEHLFAVLMELAEDPEGRLRLGRAARERVRTEFELEASAQQLSELYARSAAAP